MRPSSLAPLHMQPGHTQPGHTQPGAPELLLLGTSREVLARIVPEDPLRIRDRVARALEERALLLDPERVHLRALARTADAAPGWRGRPAVDRFLDARVDEAVKDLLAERGRPADADTFDVLAPPLGLDPARMRRASALFHREPHATRAAFLELLVGSCSLEEAATRFDRSAPELLRTVRAPLARFLAAARAPDPAPEPDGKGAAP